MPTTALITGITGQDGSYLAELLLREGYRVHGLVRRSSTFGTERIDHLYIDPHVDTAHQHRSTPCSSSMRWCCAITARHDREGSEVLLLGGARLV